MVDESNMNNDGDEIERWSRAWQGMEVRDMDWAKQAQVAHRREAVNHVAGWTGIALAALLMVAAVSRFGVLSWPQLVVGLVALLIGSAWMIHSGREIQHARTLFDATPHGVVADLLRLKTRQLQAWTSRGARAALLVMSVSAGGVAVKGLLDALRSQQWVLLRAVTLGAFVAVLCGLAAFGAWRIRALRRELDRLQQLQQQLVDL